MNPEFDENNKIFDLPKDRLLLETVADIAREDTPVMKKGVEALYDNIFNKGMLPNQALGLKERDVELLYAQGYQFYNTGKYDDARGVFSSLMLIDPLNPKYIFGQAAACHMLGQLDNAANSYNHAAMLDAENPVPYYHAADCYIKTNDPISAQVVLKLAIARCGEKPQYAVVKERSEITLKQIETKGIVEGNSESGPELTS